MLARALERQHCWQMCRCSRKDQIRTQRATEQWPLLLAT